MAKRIYDVVSGIAIRAIKIQLAGDWSAEVLLLGLYVNFRKDVIALHGRKISGAISLANSSSVNHDNYTLDSRAVKELRVRMEHLSNAGRIWKWLTELSSQMMEQVAANNVWIQRNDLAEWCDFRAAVQFLRSNQAS